MKKFFAVLIAASVLSTPMAFAKDNHRPDRHVQVEKHVTIEKKVIVKKNRWARGNKLTRAERRDIVNARDYRRHRLSEPRRGQQWVRVNNQYLLISMATGLIIGLSN